MLLPVPLPGEKREGRKPLFFSFSLASTGALGRAYTVYRGLGGAPTLFPLAYSVCTVVHSEGKVGGGGREHRGGREAPPLRPYAKERGRRGELAAVPEGTASRKVGGRPVRQAPPPRLGTYSTIQPFPWATKLDRVRLQTGAEASKKFESPMGRPQTYGATCKKAGKVGGVNCVRECVCCVVEWGSLEV